jgi:BMFP domain-containing protein YqiC
MQSQNPLIADFVKLVNGAAGTFAGMGREARESARERVREAMGGIDFVSREEFDTVKAMAAKARDENEALKKRIEALEATWSLWQEHAYSNSSPRRRPGPR